MKLCKLKKLSRGGVMLALMAALLSNSIALAGGNVSDTQRPIPEDQKFKLKIDNDQKVALNAFFEALDSSHYGHFAKIAYLRKVKPAQAKKIYGGDNFHCFLPKRGKKVRLGEIWEVDDDVTDLLEQIHPSATMNLFHAGVGAVGAWGTIRAYNNEYIEIYFRVHPEFNFGESNRFTPAMMDGRMLLERETGKILSFNISLPTNQIVNCDVSYNPNKGRGFIDMCHCPRLELVAESKTHPQKISWTKEESLEKVKERVLKKIYKYTKINWVPLEKALEISRKTKKPMHIVSFIGPLNDESC